MAKRIAVIIKTACLWNKRAFTREDVGHEVNVEAQCAKDLIAAGAAEFVDKEDKAILDPPKSAEKKSSAEKTERLRK